MTQIAKNKKPMDETLTAIGSVGSFSVGSGFCVYATNQFAQIGLGDFGSFVSQVGIPMTVACGLFWFAWKLYNRNQALHEQIHKIHQDQIEELKKQRKDKS